MATLTFTVADSDLAAVGRAINRPSLSGAAPVPPQDPAAWLASNLAQLVAQGVAAERLASMQAIGIAGDPKALGLTDAEVAPIVSARQANVAKGLPAVAASTPTS